jgi:hypothetical protein
MKRTYICLDCNWWFSTSGCEVGRHCIIGTGDEVRPRRRINHANSSRAGRSGLPLPVFGAYPGGLLEPGDMSLEGESDRRVDAPHAFIFS